MDPFQSLPESPSLKRKDRQDSSTSGYTLPVPVGIFEEPDPKRIKTSDALLPIPQKMDKVFDFLKTLKWSVEDFLRHLFEPQNHKTNRSQRHGVAVKRFLSGRDRYTVANLLNALWTTSDGAGNDPCGLYCVDTPYIDIKPVRATLSSFAAQIVEARLIQEARIAVEESSGMHASIVSEDFDSGVKWADIGASLIPTVQANLQQHQPLAFHYMRRIAEPKPQTRHGVVAVRVNRPPQLVTINPYPHLLCINVLLGRNSSPLRTLFQSFGSCTFAAHGPWCALPCFVRTRRYRCYQLSPRNHAINQYHESTTQGLLRSEGYSYSHTRTRYVGREDQ
jgi:hypothetical protein